jgi:hypothetical protein
MNNPGLRQYVKVRRIDVTIGQNQTFRQKSETRGEGRLAGATLTTNDS